MNPRLASLLLLVAACTPTVEAPPETTGPASPRLPPADTGTDPSDTGEPAPDWVPTPGEQELYTLVNDYRQENGLPAIPYSVSLSRVARTHSTDLRLHAPHTPDECNLHSWSDQGDWTPCCYTANHTQAACMWDKPRELTDYPGDGYEISAWGYDTPAAALAGWKTSPGHNNVILNLGTWSSRTWAALGVGIDGDFTNVWFGEAPDPEPSPLD